MPESKWCFYRLVSHIRFGVPLQSETRRKSKSHSKHHIHNISWPIHPENAPFPGWNSLKLKLIRRLAEFPDKLSQPENHRPHLPPSHSPVGGPCAHGSVKKPEPSTYLSQYPLIINYLLIYTMDGDFLLVWKISQCASLSRDDSGAFRWARFTVEPLHIPEHVRSARDIEIV